MQERGEEEVKRSKAEGEGQEGEKGRTGFLTPSHCDHYWWPAWTVVAVITQALSTVAHCERHLVGAE